jgi:hypothetical protein
MIQHKHHKIDTVTSQNQTGCVKMGHIANKVKILINTIPTLSLILSRKTKMMTHFNLRVGLSMAIFKKHTELD